MKNFVLFNVGFLVLISIVIPISGMRRNSTETLPTVYDTSNEHIAKLERALGEFDINVTLTRQMILNAKNALVSSRFLIEWFISAHNEQRKFIDACQNCSLFFEGLFNHAAHIQEYLDSGQQLAKKIDLKEEVSPVQSGLQPQIEPLLGGIAHESLAALREERERIQKKYDDFQKSTATRDMLEAEEKNKLRTELERLKKENHALQGAFAQEQEKIKALKQKHLQETEAISIDKLKLETLYNNLCIQRNILLCLIPLLSGIGWYFCTKLAVKN